MIRITNRMRGAVLALAVVTGSGGIALVLAGPASAAPVPAVSSCRTDLANTLGNESGVVYAISQQNQLAAISGIGVVESQLILEQSDCADQGQAVLTLISEAFRSFSNAHADVAASDYNDAKLAVQAGISETESALEAAS